MVNFLILERKNPPTLRKIFLQLICSVFFLIDLPLAGGQSFSNLPQITPSYFETFEHLKSYPSMCFEACFTDAKGRMWLAACAGSRQAGVALFQFDGYDFRVVRGDLNTLGFENKFIALYKGDKLIGHDLQRKPRQFVTYDLNTQVLEYIEPNVIGEMRALKLIGQDQLYILSQKDAKSYIYIWQEEALSLLHEFSFGSVNEKYKFWDDQFYLIGAPELGAWSFSEDGRCFLRFDFITQEVQEYCPEQFEYVLSNSFYLTNHSFYYAHDQILWQFDKERQKFVKCFAWDNTDENFKYVFEDDQGNLLIILRGPKKKIIGILKDASGHFYNYSAFFENIDPRVFKILQEGDFKETMTILHGGGITLAEVDASESIKNILPNTSVRRMVELPEEKILITSQYRETYLYDLRTEKIQPFEHEEDRLNWTLISTEEGYIWGSSLNKLFKYDPVTNTGEFIDTELGDINLYVFIDEYTLAVINRRKFVHFYDLRTNAIVPISRDTHHISIRGFPHDIHFSKSGWLWLATSDGLYKIDPSTGSYQILGSESPFPHQRFLCIHEDKRGRLWLGTPLDGVNIYDPETGDLEIINSDKGLANNTVVSILPDDNGDYWVGTYNGISILSSEGQFIANVFKKDGLSNRESNRYAYLKTKSGKLLIGTIAGLNIIDPEPLKARITNSEDIQVYLTALKYSNTEESKNSALKNYNLQPEERIILPAANRFVNLNVACSNYFRPEENQYAYKFEGIDDDWTFLGRQNILSFNNLPAGKYRLLVIAGDEIGNWSDEPLAIRIHAETIFYQQIWFYLLCVGLIVGGAFLWIYRLRQEVKKATREIETDKAIIEQQAIREKARAEQMQEQAQQIEIQAQRLAHSLEELQKKNEEIVKTQNQLVNQEKLASLGQLTAGIAHEIKNPLNFINNFAEGSVELLEELLETTDRYQTNIPIKEMEEIKGLIDDVLQNAIDIKENGNRLDQIVHSMMDHARGSNNELVEVNLNQLIDNNINLAHHGYRALESSFSVHLEKDLDPNLPFILAYPQELGRVFLNLFNNAFYVVTEKRKTSKLNYHPTVLISTNLVSNGEASPAYVQIKIRDNGKGVPEDIREKIFEPFFTTKPTGQGNTGLGLSICYDIITKIHRGQFSVQSELGEYAEFVIQLPIKP